jgi:hypothetical protein
VTFHAGRRLLSLAALVLGTGAAFLHSTLPAQLATSRVCRLFLDPHDKFTRVMPAASMQHTARLTADAQLSTINVHYGAGFPGTAQVAFQAAVDIWRTQVSSPVSIDIDANWVNFGEPLLLGEAGANCQFHDFPGAIRPSTWFVSSIAERLAGTFIEDTCASPHEIGASFNSMASWYLGTDGVPTSGTVDFESVVLHELGHGLGFIGSADVSGGLGTVGDQGLPYIYDANVVDRAGTSILNTSVYPNGSTTMASLLQGSGVSGPGLFWGGANGIAANGGARPVLYAPGSFQDGASYSHLDENTYPAGDLNSLMTPILGFAEVVHTPGPIVLGTLTDMGWGNQTGTHCSFGLDQYTASVPASGGTVNVELITAGGCAWTASTSASFVSGLAPTSGTTSARLQMSVAANSSSSGRIATVMVGTETLTIAQQGTSACTYLLSPTAATVSAGGQSGTVALTSTQGCAWTASSGDGTVASITTDPPSGQGSATIGYLVSGNTGPSIRSATLTIAGQPFSITQSACGYAVDNNIFSVSGAANTVTVNVSTTGSCQWSASTSVPFINFVSGAIGTGPGAVVLSIGANPAASSRSGNVTVAGQTVTINQGPGPPTMAIDKTALVFGATRSGSTFVAQTGSQAVRLTQSGPPGTVTWTATSSAPWLTVSPASGTGGAELTIGLQLDPTEPSGNLTGQIIIALSGAAGTVGPMNVTLNEIVASQSAPPFGSLDSPQNAAMGLSGSIPVTGWALDDVQVSRVTICRNQVAGESFGADVRCGGVANVYIGDAVFVDDARPDVQEAFAKYPLSSRAGWGYLMLTNFLANGGNGTFQLYAYANDVDGHAALLGTKTISADNADATAPFGAIDTPGQGAVVSGVVANFGWVLSPGNRRSDPPGGGTVTVFVDGAPVGSPGGWTSRSDLSSAFPQSRYSGVETALGVFSLDTTTLTDGMHTISWSVTDTLGVTSGVGSRFFTVSNESGIGDLGSEIGVRGAESMDVAAGAGSILLGRVGFDLNAPLEYFFPDSAGIVTITAHELDRIELQLEPGATAVMITPLGNKPLPSGARIDPASGLFTWAPGPGFVGNYEFAFGDRRVRMTIKSGK